MRKIFILILFCSFLSCSYGSNFSKNVIVYGKNEIAIKMAAGISLEELTGNKYSDEKKTIFEAHLFAFTNIEKSELIASPELDSIVYIAITENLFGKKIDMQNPELLENGSAIGLVILINEESVIYTLASDGEETESNREDIETGTFQLDYKNGKCTLDINVKLRDGTLFSCRYEGELVTTGTESVFQQFLKF